MSAAINPELKAVLFVPGVSVPKARPRVTNRTTRQGFAITYTPKSTVQWEKLIAIEYRRQCRGIFFSREIPLRLYAEIVMPGTGPLANIRGDWENHAKSLCDALNGIGYTDDAQIVDGRVVKRRARKGEQPGLHVLIEPASEVQSTLFSQPSDTAHSVPPWETATR